MRKALAGGAAALAIVVTAFVVAPTVWSQGGSGTDEDEVPNRERRVIRLDGRGSAIGVSIRDLDADEAAKVRTSGVFIDHVEQGGPAAKAGIRDGDVIVDFDGERVRSARQFARLVQESAGGRAVKATLLRDGSRQTVEVTPERGEPGRVAGDIVIPSPDDIEREVERGLRALPRNFAFDFNWDGEFPGVTAWPRGRLGAQLTPLSDQLAQYFGAKEGVLVSSVDPESVAAKSGLKAGDVITTVNGQAIESPRDVTQQLRGVEGGQDVEIGILRDKKAMTLKAQIPERRRQAPRRYLRPA